MGYDSNLNLRPMSRFDYMYAPLFIIISVVTTYMVQKDGGLVATSCIISISELPAKQICLPLMMIGVGENDDIVIAIITIAVAIIIMSLPVWLLLLLLLRLASVI
jgi:hypothetical protein